MYQQYITQWVGQSLEDLANQVLYTGIHPRDIGVLLYRPGISPPPISGEVLVAIVALRQAGLLL